MSTVQSTYGSNHLLIHLNGQVKHIRYHDNLQAAPGIHILTGVSINLYCGCCRMSCWYQSLGVTFQLCHVGFQHTDVIDKILTESQHNVWRHLITSTDLWCKPLFDRWQTVFTSQTAENVRTDLKLRSWYEIYSWLFSMGQHKLGWVPHMHDVSDSGCVLPAVPLAMVTVNKC